MRALLASRCATCLFLLAAASISSARSAPAANGPDQFAFAVIANVFRAGGDEAALAAAIEQTDDEDLAFVVANGVKSAQEPCSDALYGRRRDMLDAAQNGLVPVIAGSDWIGCRDSNGRPAAFERLNRLRELFNSGDLSLGHSRIPLRRQSLAPKFREYGDNAHWEIGRVMFATLNLPAENNHYLPDAGRNSEFEDRMIANQDWLHKIFLSAARKNMAGIVLFCDGNPLAPRATGPGAPRRDGFAEIRRKLVELATRYPGKVLIVHGSADAAGRRPDIAWRNNLGMFSPQPGWARIVVDPSSATLFSAAAEAPPPVPRR